MAERDGIVQAGENSGQMGGYSCLQSSFTSFCKANKKHAVDFRGDYSSHVSTDVTKIVMRLQNIREMLWFSVESGVGQ